MNKALYITIEEWAGDNNLPVTDKQINELVDAVEICSEIDIGSRGFTLGHKAKTESDIEIENLKDKLNTLESFIRDKGMNITYDNGYVTEHYMERISSSHCGSRDNTHYY